MRHELTSSPSIITRQAPHSPVLPRLAPHETVNAALVGADAALLFGDELVAAFGGPDLQAQIDGLNSVIRQESEELLELKFQQIEAAQASDFLEANIFELAAAISFGGDALQLFINQHL